MADSKTRPWSATLRIGSSCGYPSELGVASETPSGSQRLTRSTTTTVGSASTRSLFSDRSGTCVFVSPVLRISLALLLSQSYRSWKIPNGSRADWKIAGGAFILSRLTYRSMFRQAFLRMKQASISSKNISAKALARSAAQEQASAV